MNSFQISAILIQDGITTGAIYALLGMALVLVFAVSRVMFFAQGEFVVYGALSLAWLNTGKVPGTVWLLVGMALLAGLFDALEAHRDRDYRQIGRIALSHVVAPLALAALTVWAASSQLPFFFQCLIALIIVTALGPLIYRLVYQPMANASILVLLIVSVGIHFVLVSFSLIFFGVEGYRTPVFWDGSISLGWLRMNGQNVIVVAVATLLIIALAVVFSRTLWGKALRAAASNNVGARLLAISVSFSGKLSFTIAAFIGALCGMLIAPIVTIYYDSGLLIGLKGFVASIFGGLVSYPMTLIGALGIGIVESFSSFKASAYKEAVVFLLVVPVLLWLSLRSGTHEEDH